MALTYPWRMPIIGDLASSALNKARQYAERGSAELHYLQKMIGSGAFGIEAPQNVAAMVADVRRWGEVGMIPALNARRAPNRLAIIDDEGSITNSELNDAVKRRCLYHWLDYPERERELAIIRAQVPNASAELSAQVADVVSRLRQTPFANAFQRAPGIAEAVEWAKALIALDTLVLDPEVLTDTAGIMFKQRDDIAALNVEMAQALLTPPAP